jgi:hypothetical protein
MSQAQPSSTGSASEGTLCRLDPQCNLLHPFCSCKLLCWMEADHGQLLMFTLTLVGLVVVVFG